MVLPLTRLLTMIHVALRTCVEAVVRVAVGTGELPSGAIADTVQLFQKYASVIIIITVVLLVVRP